MNRRTPIDPADPQACYDAALRSLERRWHGEKELAAKLRIKGFAPDAVGDVLLRLRREGWLNDNRYAEAYARGQARKSRGPERIRAELLAAGIDGSIAASAAASIFEEGQQEAALTALCRKRADALTRRYGAAYLGTDDGRNKLIAYLLKQGYDYAAVRAAVRGLIRT
jgi:regulatory protein